MRNVYLLLFMVALTTANPLSPNIIKRSVEGDSFVYSTQRRAPELKIFNGNDAKPKQFPYQVYLAFETPDGISRCGGALISKNYVLSAAHCAYHAYPSSEAGVLLGAVNVNREEPWRIGVKTTDFLIHEGWDEDALVNDIMVLKLPYEINETDYIKVIPLPKDDSDTYAGDTGVVSGWGKTKDSDTGSTSILQYASNTILSNEECASIDPFGTILQNVHLCLSGKGNVSTCDGDSGGPLVAEDTLVGVLSFGLESCEGATPGVYTRVTKFLDWIADHTDVVI